MSLIAKDSGGGDYEQVPEGTYVARCIRVVDLGTQETQFNGDIRMKPKVMITWEILDEETKMKDGNNFVVSKRYTTSLNEKSQLRKDLQSWRGRKFTEEELAGFALTNVLGAYAMIQIIHDENNGKTYENVETIMFTREQPKSDTELVSFDLSSVDHEVFDAFSDRLKEIIRSSQEWQALDEVATAQEFPPDDLPNMNADDLAVIEPAAAAETQDESAAVDDEKEAIAFAYTELREAGYKTTIKQKVFITKVIGTGTISTMEQAEKVSEALAEAAA